MDSDYIRKKTKIVVCRDRQYLVGATDYGQLIWSRYLYDAWGTRHIRDAVRVARKVGGQLILFNSVTGETEMISNDND